MGYPTGSSSSGAGSSDTLESTQLLVKTAVQSIDTKTGEVGANPTTNTILGRLKDLLTNIVLAAGNNIIGKFGIDQTTNGVTNGVFSLEAVTILPLTLTLDTAIYADGDVLADTQVLANAARINDGLIEIRNITVIDSDDQGQPFDLWFFSSNVSLGTENSVPSITDINAETIVGKVEVSTIDYYDLGGCKVAIPSFFPILLKPSTGTTNIYVAAISRGTGTYTASGIKLNIGVRQF